MAFGIGTATAQGAGAGATPGATQSGFWQGTGGQAIAQGASGILGGAMGMMTRNWYDKRQRRQQEKLNQIGIRGGKEMAEYNQQLAKKMWDYTNYENQRKHIQNAGLNVGLMYGGAGQGGTTAGGQGQAIPSGYAPAGSGDELALGMQLGMKAVMDVAQAGLQKAQTTEIITGLPNIPKQGAVLDTQAGVNTATIEKLKAETTNTDTATQLAQNLLKIREIELQVKEHTKYDEISIIQSARDTAIQNAQIIKNQRDVSDATKDNQIKLSNQAVLESGLRMNLMREEAKKLGFDMKLIEANINKISEEVLAIPANMALQARQTRVQEILANYQTEGAQKRDTETYMMVVNGILRFLEIFVPN